MQVWIEGALNAPLTFLFNFIVLDYIWKTIEYVIHGETQPSTEDSIMLIIFCLIYTVEAMNK